MYKSWCALCSRGRIEIGKSGFCYTCKLPTTLRLSCLLYGGQNFLADQGRRTIV